MKFRVIAYEGARNDNDPMTCGAAAIQMENGRIMNAVTRFEPGITMEQAKAMAEEDAALEFLPNPFEFESKEFPNDAYVFDLPTALWTRQPYTMPTWEISARLHGFISCGERTFLIFNSHTNIQRWLSSLHFKRGFSLTKEQ